MKTIERTIYELCEEIDDLRDSVQYWKQKYETERDENISMVNDRLKQSHNGVATALALALCISDNPDGSLSISKENGQVIADSITERCGE
jgi:predicted phage tail protein